MRRLLCLFAAVALVLGTASTTQAKIVDWSGTLTIHLGTLGDFISDPGTGVATTNGTAGINNHVNTVHFGANTLNLSGTIPLTDPENATLLTLVGSNITIPSTGQLGAQPGTTIVPSQMAMGGLMKVCILFPGCGSYLPVPIAFPVAGPPFTRGAGIGGTATVNTFSVGPGLKLSLAFNPWTLGVTSMVNVSTTFGTTTVTNATSTRQGFKHGPVSLTSSTAAASGVIQWVSATRIVTTVDQPSTKLAVPSILKLHFVPEPGMVLLLASGVGGLVLLGRSRMRR
jgi:hypothetical protein